MQQSATGTRSTSYNFLWRLAKIGIALALTYIIYRQVASQEQWTSWSVEIQSLSTLGKWPLLCLAAVISLVPINWGLEAGKWRRLHGTPISWWDSYRSILAGQATAIVTPAGLGEYAGRMAYAGSGQEASQSAAATLVASLAQNLCNVAFGSLAGLLFIRQYYDLAPWLLVGTASAAVIVIGLGLAVYSRLDTVLLWLTEKSWASKHLQKWGLVHVAIPQEQLSTILLLSSLRYMVYMLQYVLILQVFGVGVGLWAAVGGIGLIYLVQTGLPLPPFLGILARGEVAILVWSTFGASVPAILAATFSLWLINKVGPAILGLAFFLWHNVKPSR